MVFTQSAFDLRCEWGERGVAALAPASAAVIIVDVLSFSTSVSVAVERGACVFPYRWNDQRAADYAASVRAELAAPRGAGRPSLSPASLRALPPGARLVLPSPNGGALSLAAGSTPVFAGCLRNARAVALAAQALGAKIAVIPAGERWPDDQSLRPAVEDWLGAGAILSHLPGQRSPEAASAVAAFQAARPHLDDYLHQCPSGQELIARGFAGDVALAAELDVSAAAPLLIEGAFRPADSAW
jgi:2-phosphosulfolactate phosphatase